MASFFPLTTGTLLLTGALAGALTGFVLRPDGGGGNSTAREHGDPTAPRGASASPLGKRRLLPRTQARLDALRLAGTPSRQIAAALELAGLTAVAEIRDLLEHSHEFPDNSSQEVAIATLLKRWLELDPRAALEFCRMRHPRFLPRLAGQWSLSHPDEAVAWVKTHRNAQPEWMELCKSISTRDPAKGWDMLGRLPGLDTRHTTLQIDAIVRRLVAGDMERAIASLHTMPPAVVAAARKAIAERLMESDPDKAWEWARSQSKPLEATGAALAQAMKEDAGKSLEFMKSLSAADLKTAINQSDYGRRWIISPDFAERLAADTGLDAASKQLIADSLFGRLSWTGADRAASLWPLMSGDAQARQLPNYVRNWSRQDSAAAQAWVESLPEGELRTGALAVRAAFEKPDSTAEPGDPGDRLAVEFTQGLYIEGNDPRISRLNATQLGKILTSVKANDSHSVGQILSGLSASNPRLAAAWLESAALDSTNGPMAARFSANWAGNDPAAAAAWVSGLPPDGHLARVAARNVAGEYARYAPEQAAEWIGTLPAGPVRDAARAGLEKP